MACLPLGPLIKAGNINDDLAVGSQFYVGSVHWSGSRSFKVDAFVVVPTTVAGTLEFVFAGLPIGGAAQMSASRINDKQSVGCAVHPDPVFLLKLSIDTQ